MQKITIEYDAGAPVLRNGFLSIICNRSSPVYRSEHTFGGTVVAGIHLDGVITKPELLLDGHIIVKDGTVLLDV
jgi:hypothetical protein